MRKLAIGQGEDFTTRCLLDYEYIKNNYRLRPSNLSGQKELDDDPKAFQKMEFVEQLKNADDVNPDGTKSVFQNNFRKNQRKEVRVFPRKCDSIIKDGKLSRSESETNKYTIKQMKICSKK